MVAVGQRAYDAVVFDFDGVILDTETPFYDAWREAYEGLGLELTVDEWATCIGTHGSGFDPFADLGVKRPGEDLNGTFEQVRARKTELTDLDTLLPGIAEWLDAAAEAGVAVAVASSSTHDWVHGNLSRLMLADRFGHFSCRTDEIRRSLHLISTGWPVRPSASSPGVHWPSRTPRTG